MTILIRNYQTNRRDSDRRSCELHPCLLPPVTSPHLCCVCSGLAAPGRSHRHTASLYDLSPRWGNKHERGCRHDSLLKLHKHGEVAEVGGSCWHIISVPTLIRWYLTFGNQGGVQTPIQQRTDRYYIYRNSSHVLFYFQQQFSGHK